MRHRLALSLTAVLLLVGCGGGAAGDFAGGPPPAPDLFSGAFHVVLVGVGFEGGAANSVAIWGTAAPDGAGLVPVTITENADGAIAGPALRTDFGYGMNTARDLTWFAAATPGTTELAGGLSADGDKALMAGVQTGENPVIGLFLRKSGAHTNGSLSGNYHLGAFFTADNETSPMPRTLMGTAVFGGAGTGTATGTDNYSGAIDPFSDSVTYSVAADGTLTYTQRGGMSGGVTAGGEIAVVGGSTSSVAEQRMLVLLREATTATTALFAGSYRVVVFEGDSGMHMSVTGTLVADGTGGISFTGTENAERVVSPTGPDTATYAVSADGSLTITTGGSGDVLEGGISADGTFGFAAGGTAPGSPQTFVIFVK